MNATTAAGGTAALNVAIRSPNLPILVFVCPNCEQPASSFTTAGALEVDRHGQVSALRACARCGAAFSLFLGSAQDREPEPES